VTAAADRLSRPHYTPHRIPAQVRRHAGDPDTLGVGRPGKVGLLELGFEPVDRRTELVRHYQKTPLQIMRPLYIDPHRTDLPVVYLMSTGGGIVQADRLRTDIDCAANASVHVTTQAATKVHRMDADFATQMINIGVGPHGYVEYLPDPIIPFGGSRFYQQSVLTVDASATLLAGETVMAGRLARGERHDYDVFAADLELRRPGGELIAIDTVRLQPRWAPVTGPGLLGKNTLMATFFVVSPLRSATAVADALHAALHHHTVHYGVSVLPHESGAWARILSVDPPALHAAMRSAWNAVRQLLLEVPAPDLRKT